MPRPLPKDRRSGFALLITITLLAFLVLLLVSLATLTRVETQVASNSQQISKARQNALMALNIALGQLQLTLGPDQRVSVTAAQQGDGTASYAAADTDNNAHWTGVYRQDPTTTTRTPQLLSWLVSGNQDLPIPTNGANSPAFIPNVAVVGLSTTTSATTPVSIGTSVGGVTKPAVLLVGAGSTSSASMDNFVVAPLQAIQVQAKTLPGFDPTSITLTTIGNFAYWVGDEGVKAKATLIDPGAAATATAADKTYRFVNAQRFGIEGVDQSTAATPLSTDYPANAADLPKVLDLKQLSLLSTGGQAALTTTAKNRFHDLTATSRSVLADVAQGGLKKDLTAWIADPSTPSNPSGSASAVDDYITAGDSTDTGKYGLPKWALIRSYAQTLNTGAALAPRPQTDSQQGISPVMTYARMGYNMTMPPSGGGIYHINVMPVVALWNPYNVPIQASTDSSNTYEFCVKYKPTVFVSLGARVVPDGVRLRLVFTSAVAPANATDSFYLGSIQIQSGAAGPLGPAGIFASYATGSSAQISASSGPAAFWRFKLKLSRTLAPGESRLFTISDASDNTQYVAGQAELSDATLDTSNSVYLPSNTPLNASQMVPDARIFWNTEPAVGGAGTSRAHAAMTAFRLTKPVPAGVSTAAAIDTFLEDNANTYQAILGNAFNWDPETNGVMFPDEMFPPNNNGRVLAYQRVELLMSSNYDRFVSGSGSPGTPRWLAQLNPQAAVSLRKPVAPVTPDTPLAQVLITPSYETQRYIKREGVDPTNYPYILIPDANGTDVSAGTQVATTGTAQNVVLREFQPDATTLLSLGQLQHVNASLLNLNPAYPIGNSLANLYVPRTGTQSELLANDAFNSYSPNNTYPGFPDSTRFQHIYDLSYLLNKALWDGCFFSTVPSSLTTGQAANPTYHLPNARHQLYWNTGVATAADVAALKITGTAAAHLLVNGGFNVNSTSEQAWRALLYSHNGVATDPADATGKTKHPYSRFTVPVDSTQPNTTWPGYRILSDDQIAALATAIVAEVRTRGPFLSLADFVNRRLAADATGLKGPLQAAIDTTTSGAASINGRAPFNSTANSTSVSLYAPDISGDAEQQTIYTGGTYATLPSTAPSASRATFAPGYLTQADLLNALGPSLTARSDTFRIRTYGDSLNPSTGSTTPEARAWCEAVVQRLPDYVDPALPAETDLTAAPASTAKITNQTFGRRFKIISFRWLSPNDI